MNYRATGFLALFFAALGASPALACPTCFTVFSIQLYNYLGPPIEAHVKVQPLPSGCTTVVQGRWTEPDGNTVTRYAIASGTRKRAEFPLYTTQTGDVLFEVLDITCSGSGYSYNGNDSASYTIPPPSPVSSPVAPPVAAPVAPPVAPPVAAPVAPPVAPPVSAPVAAPVAPPVTPPTTAVCTADCARVKVFKMLNKNNKVIGRVQVKDENDNKISGAVVSAYWTLPDGSMTDTQSKTTNSQGKASFTTPEGSSGDYTITVTDVSTGGSLTFDPENSALEKTIGI